MRYWYHPESDSLWSSEKDELLNSDGFVEEISYNEYIQLKGKLNMPYDDSFDASQFEPSQSGGAHPVGKFPAVISNTAIKPTKLSDGGLFEVEFSTQAGNIANRYNLWNKNTQAVEIAQKQLSALCYATGIFKLDFKNDAAVLRGAKLIIEVDHQKNRDGTPNGYVEVKKVYDLNGNEPGRSTPAPQPAPQQAQQPAQQAAPAPSNGNGGWGAPAPQNAPAPAAAPQQGWSQSSPQNNTNAPPWAK